MSRAHRLIVDPTACDGYGSCAELLPEWITPDEWGFPIIRSEAVPAHLMPLARLAVKACPRLALMLQAVASRPRAPTARGSGPR